MDTTGSQGGRGNDQSEPLVRGWRRYGLAEIDQMTQGRWSPVVMRRLLGLRLEDARRQAGLGQAPAAKTLGWALRKLHYVEDASRPIADRADLEAAIHLYGPSQEEAKLWARLWELSREPAWWDNHQARLDRHQKRVIGTEWGCRRLWAYIPVLIPIHLQTAAYADAVLRQVWPYESGRVVEAWRDIAVRRRALVQGRTAGSAHLIMEESALYRQVGGRKVLADQLAALCSAIKDSPNVEVSVVPFSAGYIAPIRSSFVMIGLDPKLTALADVVNVEVTPSSTGPLGHEVRIVDEDEVVAAYERAFNMLANMALDRDETFKAIERAHSGLVT